MNALDLPDTFDLGPINVGRRWFIGLDPSLADCERIRIIGPKFSSVLFGRLLPAVLLEGKKVQIITG